MKKLELIKFRTVLIFSIIVIFSAFFRFYNLNWDQGYAFHPDERNIAMAVLRINFFDSLDPEFFAYGGFSVYLYRAVIDVFSLFFPLALDWGTVNLVGRYFSALFSTILLVPMFFLVNELFSRRVALMSVFLTAFCVSLIQTAHFSVTESLLTLEFLLIAFLSIKIFEKPVVKKFILLGVLIGISVATKTTALSFLGLPFLAIILRALKLKRIEKNFVFWLLVTFLIGFVVFVIFSPFTFLSHEKFLESMEYEVGVIRGTVPVPYTLQFENTTKYLFQLQNLFFQIGPVFLLSIAGFILLITNSFTSRKINGQLILWIYALIFFVYIGFYYTKFIRYTVPLIPFLTIFAAVFMDAILKSRRRIGIFVVVLFCLSSVIWTTAFMSIYYKEQTRIAASFWVYENVVPGSRILREHWDDGLPIHFRNKENIGYETFELPLYDADSKSKADMLANELATSDYIIINSRRLWGTLMYLPEKYPMTSGYYSMLFSGDLGYERVVEFSSTPSLLWFQIPEQYTEETYQVYDHPTVMIFKNEERYSEEELKLKLVSYLER